MPEKVGREMALVNLTPAELMSRRSRMLDDGSAILPAVAHEFSLMRARESAQLSDYSVPVAERSERRLLMLKEFQRAGRRSRRLPSHQIFWCRVRPY